MNGVPAAEQRTDRRGDASLVGIVILFGMVIVGASLVLVAGLTMLEDVRVDATDERTIQDFRTLDKALTTGPTLGDDSISFDLEPGEDGRYAIADRGRLSINVTNRFGTTCTLEGGEMTLGTLEYENSRGETVASQAGGIWQRTEAGTRVVSEPGIRYYTDVRNGIENRRLEVSVTTFQGTVGSGKQHADFTPRAPEQADCFETIGFPSEVTVVVEDTPYHDGWATFLREEFSPHGEFDHDPTNRRVVAEAPLGHTRPFADYVDLEPTIYGGLYVAGPQDGRHSRLDGSLTVEGYDSREGPYGTGNVTTDLLVADTDELRLLPSASISGYPVVSGDLRAQPGATVSPFVYRHGKDLSPPAAGDDVRSIEVSERFEPIEPVDEAIADAHRYLRDQPTLLGNETTPGEYRVNGNLALSGVTFDVSGEDTHVAVDGDVSLTDVSVAGGGQVHIYAGGNEIDLERVDVPDDRADAIWIYGGNETSVTIADRFQGVVYAPGRGDLVIEDDTEIYGAVVGGELGPGVGSNDVGDDVTVRFDTALRSAVPIPEEERSIERSVRSPLDVAFVLDRSGSMDEQCGWWYCQPGNDPEERRLDATRRFIDELDEAAGDRVGAYEFNTRGREIHEFSGDFDAVEDALEANANGKTNMAAGMEAALDGYVADGGSGERVMVLLSDGKNSEYRYDAATRSQARRAADMDVTVYTVGLGDDLNDELLEEVAETTGGEYVHVDEAAELESIFEAIAVEVIEAADVEFETIAYDGMGAPDEYVIRVKESTVDVGE